MSHQKSRRDLSVKPECSTATPIVKAVFEAFAKLRRKRDFGHQNQRRTALSNRGLRRTDVDFRFSAARDAKSRKDLNLRDSIPASAAERAVC